MNQLFPFPGLAIFLCILIGCAVVIYLVRHWQPKPYGRPPRRTPPSTLPAMLQSDMNNVLEEAQEAANRRALTGRPVANPHPKGSRAYVLWETQYHRSLLDSIPWPEEVDK